MFDRLSRSWDLVKASGSVLMQDQQLIVFPLISSLATFAVALCFILPAFGLGAFDGFTHGHGRVMSTGLYLLVFCFYIAQYFVIFFFNSALVGAALVRLNGGTPTVGEGLRIASSKMGAILGYALIAATVGMLLRAIQERVGFIGKIIVGLLGAGWTMATYLVVPVLVARDVGPVDAIGESASLLKKTWGENVIGQAGMGMAFGLIQFAVIAAAILLVVLAAMTKSWVLIVAVALVALTAVILVALVHAALTGIYSAALYRYASTGEGSGMFAVADLRSAFSGKP
jgi:hypothetical protein